MIHRRLKGRYGDFEHRVRVSWDILQAPNAIFHSAASDPPMWCNRPWVQTLHDVPLAFRSADHGRELREWTRRRRKLREAAAVIAVSGYVADTAISVLKLEAARVHVIHHGVDPTFSPADERLLDTARPADRDPYLLLVSEYGPHKGYGEAFELISRLAKAGLPHRLVVAGTVAPWWRPAIDRLLGACSHPDRVVFTDYVDDPTLAGWYRGADALVITSRSEGFGLPAIEAMACGTPVVAFDNTALPEIVGSGGLLVTDGDVEAMAEAVRSLLSDAGSWRAACAAALQRSERFSWPESARAHAGVYSQVGISS
jgi:glycosyltransferase involved in cell wall biosynthesis